MLFDSLIVRYAKSGSQDPAESIRKARALAESIKPLRDDQVRYHATVARNDTELDAVHGLVFSIEAVRRTLNLNVYDRQIEAALVLASGGIAEMQTGEGKTFSGVVAAIIFAMQSRHVHVATANDYLARRDFELLTPVLNLLELTTGLSTSDQTIAEKQAAYSNDVVFATGYQFGFDYLRDQLTLAGQPRYRLGQQLLRQLKETDTTSDGLCQQGHDVAIVDEVDSVLIDEAMTPLVLSGEINPSQTNANADAFDLARKCAMSLHQGIDFRINDQQRNILLTPMGTGRAMDAMQGRSRSLLLDCPWPLFVQSALRAEYLLRRNVDYVVRNDQVQIVDASTGRIVPDRQWRSGLHQAVETKENVTRTQNRKTLARMSRQRYFGRYQTLSGMTGTASGHQHEWKNAYNLSVQVIPTRLTSKRIELPTLYVASQDEKLRQIVAEANRCKEAGQPILIGTRTIEQTHLVSQSLLRARIGHQVLNGVQDETEADLIASAGKSGSVTVATNMAGRGTDITLDQNAIHAGGLHVIGFERNDSSRIDRQLLGRAARQGQPGSGRFIVAPDDQLVVRHDSRLAKQISKLRQPTTNTSWDRRIEKLQLTSENERYESRQQTADQEEWLNELRKHVA